MLSRVKNNLKGTTLGKYIVFPIYRAIFQIINFGRHIQLLMIFFDSHKMYKTALFFAKCHILIPGYYPYFRRSSDYSSHVSAAKFFDGQLKHYSKVHSDEIHSS